MKTIFSGKSVLAFSLCAVLILTACGGGGSSSSKAPASGGAAPGSIPVPSSPLKYSMAGGSVGGNFYIMGGGLAQTINKHLPKYFMVTSETT